MKPSEDVAHLLVSPESTSHPFDHDAPRDFLPDPNIDWVVDFAFDKPISKANMFKQLDSSWLNGHKQPTIYGIDAKEKRWSYVHAADSPDTYDKLKIAWTLWDAIAEKPFGIVAEDLERFQNDAESRLSKLAESMSYFYSSHYNDRTFVHRRIKVGVSANDSNRVKVNHVE